VTDPLYQQIGKRIKEARDLAGLSQEQLAKKAQYGSAATIWYYESGTRKIGIADLKRLATALNRPLDYFLDERELDDGLHRFRLRAASKVSPVGREAVAQFLAFAEEHGSSSAHFPATYAKMPPELAAARILGDAGINEPPVDPKQVATQIGVTVIPWDFPDAISGIFSSDEGALCIGVNKWHHAVRQRFTVAHEIGHLIYGEGDDLFVDHSSVEWAAWAVNNKQQRLERKANQFAAHLLMPQSWLRRDFHRYGEDVGRLAQIYGVSEQAMWIQLTNSRLG
jgi:Zn-dependent peptidase ImmA (M78 family)/transcriptional regulator with XRE-family HTH domain